MPKRAETIELENSLIDMCKEKRLYGCEEITIGFAYQGRGNEIVDFMTMDSKGVIKCYELKVTLADLKSNAKKSWYGNYNYLVVSRDLYNKVKDFSEYIPDTVGIIVGTGLESIRKAKKMNINPEIGLMLKESMVRSMYWKMDKYKDANSLEKQKQLNAKVRKAEKDKDAYYKRAVTAENLIYDYETYHEYNTGEEIDFPELVKREKEKWRETRRKRKM